MMPDASDLLMAKAKPKPTKGPGSKEVSQSTKDKVTDSARWALIRKTLNTEAAFNTLTLNEIMLSEMATRHALDSFYQWQDGGKTIKVCDEVAKLIEERGARRTPCFFDDQAHL